MAATAYRRGIVGTRDGLRWVTRRLPSRTNEDASVVALPGASVGWAYGPTEAVTGPALCIAVSRRQDDRRFGPLSPQEGHARMIPSFGRPGSWAGFSTVHPDFHQTLLQKLLERLSIGRGVRSVRASCGHLACARALRANGDRGLDRHVSGRYGRCDHDEVLVAHAYAGDLVTEGRAEKADDWLSVPRLQRPPLVCT